MLIIHIFALCFTAVYVLLNNLVEFHFSYLTRMELFFVYSLVICFSWIIFCREIALCSCLCESFIIFAVLRYLWEYATFYFLFSNSWVISILKLLQIFLWWTFLYKYRHKRHLCFFRQIDTHTHTQIKVFPQLQRENIYEKNKIRWQIFSDFKAYCKDTVIKTVWY